MGFAANQSGSRVLATSEDATAQDLAGRQRTTSAVPRGDGSPSGHGRVAAAAVFSEDRSYRYLLVRAWAAGPAMTFVMLNPSTADETTNDPTLRRCIGFARAAGCGAVRVVNLCAWRASDPAALRMVSDPVGPSNNKWLAWAVAQAGPLVAALGARADLGRVAEVLALIGSRDLQCLGLTANGHPRHPLYLPSTTPLRRLDVGACGTSKVGGPRDVVAANAGSPVLRRHNSLQEAWR